MTSRGQIAIKRPWECTEIELEDFASLVRAGGEVDERGLATRIRSAALLVFLFENKCLLGIAAAKTPLPTYRKSISEKSHIPLPKVKYPHEVGWVFVMPSARGRRHSHLLLESLMTHLGDVGTFATSRTDNAPMHKSLMRFGFVPVGQSYEAARGNYRLQLFLRQRSADN
jgi:predicted GNAT family N-acyltransferase